MAWKHAEVAELTRRAHRVARSAALDIKAVVKREGDPSRLVIIAPKKIGDAPTRNRSRRRIREIVRPLFKQLSYPIDLVIFLKQEVGTVPFAPLSLFITQSLKDFLNSAAAK